MEYLFTEFDSWKNENQDFYEELQEHEAVLFDRFYPVFAVLEQIEKQVMDQTLKMDEDLQKIFDVGLAFLHDQFESCKIYLETTFQNDFHAFLEYEKVINFVLFVEDVRYELQEKNADYDDTAAEELLDKLEGIITEHQPIDENLGLYVDDRVNALIGDHDPDMYGIIDIFTDVAETLGLYLYENDDIVIGKDI